MAVNSIDKKSEYMLEKIDKTWKPFFESFGWQNLFSVLEKAEKDNFVPAKEDVFRLFRKVSLENLKVVVIGQDPYHQKGIADGFSFSTRKKLTPASLNNIFLELQKDLGVVNSRNDLESWVEQGVFLLNTCLTVEEGRAFSHKNLWEDFSKSLISYINNEKKELVWVLWGNNAKSFREKCGIESEFVIESSHPSPFSAGSSFFNSRPFSKINSFLRKKGEKEISWET